MASNLDPKRLALVTGDFLVRAGSSRKPRSVRCGGQGFRLPQA